MRLKLPSAPLTLCVYCGIKNKTKNANYFNTNPFVTSFNKIIPEVHNIITFRHNFQILIDHGAKMPSLHEVLQRVSEEVHERAIARHAWHEAHASDAYILLSSKDPIQTAFDMASKLKKLGAQFPQHKGM